MVWCDVTLFIMGAILYLQHFNDASTYFVLLRQVSIRPLEKKIKRYAKAKVFLISFSIVQSQALLSCFIFRFYFYFQCLDFIWIFFAFSFFSLWIYTCFVPSFVLRYNRLFICMYGKKGKIRKWDAGNFLGFFLLLSNQSQLE